MTEERVFAEPDDVPALTAASVANDPEAAVSPGRMLPVGPFSFGEWLRVRFLGHDVAAAREEQLASLNRAIRRNPASPSNYVLRGELYLTVGYDAMARLDFQRALQLANKEYENDAWGLLAQALRDRAQAGLRRLGD
jgi:tetratricopeptide (TPR) repeat protein